MRFWYTLLLDCLQQGLVGVGEGDGLLSVGQLHLNLADLAAQDHLGDLVVGQENVDRGGDGFALSGGDGLRKRLLAGGHLGAAAVGDDGFEIAVGNGDGLC